MKKIIKPLINWLEDNIEVLMVAFVIAFFIIGLLVALAAAIIKLSSHTL